MKLALNSITWLYTAILIIATIILTARFIQIFIMNGFQTTLELISEDVSKLHMLIILYILVFVRVVYRRYKSNKKSHVSKGRNHAIIYNVR